MVASNVPGNSISNRKDRRQYCHAEAAGVQRKVRIDFIKEPKVGDFIIVHAGFAIEKMKEDQALRNLEAISEAANAV